MNNPTRRMLIDQGHLTQSGLTKKARHRHCPGCGLVLLAAQDMGREIWCDPYPITVAGELGALLAGRPTFSSPTGSLNIRLASRIAFRDANAEPVYSEHRCGMPQPEINHRHIRERTQPTYSDSDQPPF